MSDKMIRIETTRLLRIRNRHLAESVRAGLIHGVLVLAAVAILLPFVWMISTSLKPPMQVLIYPPQWIPSPVQWRNYTDALFTSGAGALMPETTTGYTPFSFALFLRNTATITVLDVVGQVLSSSLVAFAFARLRWPGRDAVFLVVLSTMMLPYHVTIIPRFVMFRELGWIDTFAPLIVPSYFGNSFFIFLLRQFMLTVPLQMDEAARVDGASFLDIYWHIVLPLTKPALIAVSIFVFNWTWNDFLGPLIYLQSKTNYTISLGLRLFQTQYGTEWHLLMAASLISMLPVVALFFAAQEYFIQGVVFWGVKG